MPSRPVLIGRGLVTHTHTQQTQPRVHYPESEPTNPLPNNHTTYDQQGNTGHNNRTYGSQSYGGHSDRETPGPIPNPEVKPASADGTATERLWESRTPPNITHREATSRWPLRYRWDAGFPTSPSSFSRSEITWQTARRRSAGRCATARRQSAAVGRPQSRPDGRSRRLRGQRPPGGGSRAPGRKGDWSRPADKQGAAHRGAGAVRRPADPRGDHRSRARPLGQRPAEGPAREARPARGAAPGGRRRADRQRPRDGVPAHAGRPRTCVAAGGGARGDRRGGVRRRVTTPRRSPSCGQRSG